MVTTRTRPDARRCRRRPGVRRAAVVLPARVRDLDARVPRVPGARARLRLALAALAAGLVPCGLLAARARGGRRARPRCGAARPAARRAPLVARRGRSRLRRWRRAVALAFARGRGRSSGRCGWPPRRRADRGRAGAARAAGRAAPRRPAPAPRSRGRPAVAVLSLFLVKPNADDAYYLRQAAWIAEHGRFPLATRCTRTTSCRPRSLRRCRPTSRCWGRSPAPRALTAPELAYLVVAPRRQRARGARAVAAAAHLGGPDGRARAEHRARVPAVRGRARARPRRGPRPPPRRLLRRAPWQGKVILAAVLVPLLFSLAARARARRRGSRAARRRRRRRGRAVHDGHVPVPVIALACLVPVARRAPRHAARGGRGLAPTRWPRWRPRCSPRGANPRAGGRSTSPRRRSCCPAVGSGLLAFVAVIGRARRAAAARAPLRAARHGRGRCWPRARSRLACRTCSTT